MTWAVIIVPPDADIRNAARIMHERKVGALPVADGGRVVGILAASDVIGAVVEFPESRRSRRRRLSGPAAGSPG